MKYLLRNSGEFYADQVFIIFELLMANTNGQY
ncbi:hypothetical protein MNBD_GAMMA10-861 [hydrothermal vent metagenome]|uniref:Uncharacterized protein n=1 Tax=hydrothermal vent metagenome TaxID=652676 RepID=A0A3B0Y7B8_9ZZZZ